MTYVLSAYEPQLKVFYDDNVMPVLEKFIPTIWSFLFVLIILVFCLITIRKRAVNGYQYSSKVASIVTILLALIIKFRFSGAYYYYPLLEPISYVDVIGVLLLSYLFAFIYNTDRFYQYPRMYFGKI